MPIRRRHLLAWALTAPVVGLSACGRSGDKAASQNDNRVEVFSWWAGTGEKEGFDALIAEFKRRYPGVEFINAVVAGGAGTNAKAVLASRLRSGDPPDSYQAHAGLELASDIKAGWVQDLSYLYKQEGWTDKFPSGLVDAITVAGKIYSVPVNIHRANLLWYRPKVLHDAGIGGPPTTWKEFLAQASVLTARHVTALSIGPIWTQKHLLENVLLGELGPDRYTGLWNGGTDWKSPPVTETLETFKKVLAVSDLSSALGDWQPAVDEVMNGVAAYNVMGDWVDAYLARSRNLKYRTDYDVVTAPGTRGVYDFLSDSFTLPKGAPHRASAEKWLMVCGSVDGQDAFNPLKGSVPARIDADRSRYHAYLAGAMTDWLDPRTRVVGSLTHGVVAGPAWNDQIDKALAQFVQDSNTPTFVDAVVAHAPFR